MTDELLVVRCQLGEREAFADLLRAWHDRLRTYVWRMSASADADDVTQEVWLAVLGGLAVAAVVGLLWATEPGLPPRTQVAFGAIVVAGLAWFGYGLWALTWRLPLFALDRVVAAWMGLAACGLVRRAHERRGATAAGNRQPDPGPRPTGRPCCGAGVNSADSRPTAGSGAGQRFACRPPVPSLAGKAQLRRSGADRTVVRRVIGWMPRGAHLSPASFASRHRLNIGMLWLHPPIMTAVGVAGHRAAATVALLTLPQVLLALLASAARTRTAKATLTSAGFISGTVAAIELSNGAVEAHFHVFVILVFVALYQQWYAMIATLVIGLVHHVGLGLVRPAQVFGHHHLDYGTTTLLELLGVHVAALFMEIVGIMVFWHFAEAAEAETHAAQEKVRRERQRFQALVQKSSDVTLVAGPGGFLTWVSPAAMNVMGYRPADLAGMCWTTLVHPSDQARGGSLLAETSAESDGATRAELRIRHASGDWRWHEITVRNLTSDPAVDGLVLNHRDVTERREYQDRLAHEASHDSLTNLLNRATFFRVLEQALARAGRHGGALAVLFIDLDGFKQVNDTLGHDSGDAVLRAAAERLATCVRTYDTVARLGGDEFVVLVDGLAPIDIDQQTEIIVARAIAELERPIQLSDGIARVSGSVGIAVSVDGDQTADGLMRAADAAMYVTKRARRSPSRQ